MRKVIVAGATSAIAEATCRLFAKQGDRLYLVGRREDKLKNISIDLKTYGADRVDYQVLDLSQLDDHKQLLENANLAMDGVDMLFIAYGTLPDQQACEESFELALQEFNTNCISILSLISLCANLFQKQENGHIVVITSVAGDRGRGSNYFYGSAKGTISIFLQGLRCRLHNQGVNVLTVKPGFVDTPMTSGFSKGVLWSSPQKIARGILSAINKKEDVVYLPSYWKVIMSVIKLIPESIFKRLSL